MKILLALLLFAAPLGVWGSEKDTTAKAPKQYLVFEKKKNPEKTFSIPFNEAGVAFFLDGRKRVDALITDFDEDVIIVNEFDSITSEKEVELEKIKYKYLFNPTKKIQKVAEITCTKRREIKINEIKKIRTNNFQLSNHRKMANVASLIAIACYSVSLITITSTDKGDFDFASLTGIMVTGFLAASVVGISFSKKKLNLKRKWQVRGMEEK